MTTRDKIIERLNTYRGMSRQMSDTASDRKWKHWHDGQADGFEESMRAVEELMPATDKMTRPIVSFVKKSGGIDMVNEARKRLTGVSDYRALLKRLANKSDEAGAKQLVAAAILGFTMAAIVYQATTDDDPN